MLRIGITGGIGSGKSTVCRIFGQLGVPVFYADQEARALYDNRPELREALKAAFGSGIYEGEKLNRQALAAVVFRNAGALERLNGLVHPYVFQMYEDWCTVHSGYHYTLKEAAIMFESGSYKRLHFVIAVTAPLELRIQRVTDRDGLSRAAVMDRMHNQMPQDELVKRCRFEIINDGQHSLISQVLELHGKISGMPPDLPLPQES